MKSTLCKPLVKTGSSLLAFRDLVEGTRHIFSQPSFSHKIGTILPSKWEVTEQEREMGFSCGKAVLQPVPTDGKHNTSEPWRRRAGWGGEVSAF